MTDKELIRLLVREMLDTELNEFFGNFMKSGQQEDPSVTAAKKMLDAHFSGIMKKDDSVVNNLISKLPSQDQATYKAKLASIKKQPTRQTQQPETATQMQMRKNAELRRSTFANENKKRRFAALR